MNRFSRQIKIFGPGIMFASTSIGVSHLVQSTRAGAEYGFALLGFVVLALVLKYPFFEYASRFANATNTTIIDGYAKMGRPILFLYLGITVSSMFFITAAVGFVAAGFFSNLFEINFLGSGTIIIIFAICAVILILGRFSVLDGLLKIISTILVASTILAFVFAVVNGPIHPLDTPIPNIWDSAGIFFLLALMGWMPTALDLSAWNSIWTIERFKQTKFKPTLKETLFEFNIGYIITGALALVFLTLGAYILFGTGQELPNNGAMFASKVVSLFTQTIGDFSYYIIAVSAFSIMLGTIILVFDGYSRTLQKTIRLIHRPKEPKPDTHKIYVLMLFILLGGSLIIVLSFVNQLKLLVDFATTISFIVAPVIAIINFKLVTGKYTAKETHPPMWLKILGYAGIIFLILFVVIFLVTRF